MDIIDEAKIIEQAQRKKAVEAVTNKLKGQGTAECIDCDTEIPAARRAAYPAATRCIECQTKYEANA